MTKLVQSQLAERLQNMEISNERTKPYIKDGILYESFQDETQLPFITKLMEADLSEPYSIYTYRYFIHNCPQLCWIVSFLNLLKTPEQTWLLK